MSGAAYFAGRQPMVSAPAGAYPYAGGEPGHSAGAASTGDALCLGRDRCCFIGRYAGLGGYAWLSGRVSEQVK